MDSFFTGPTWPGSFGYKIYKL